MPLNGAEFWKLTKEPMSRKEKPIMRLHRRGAEYRAMEHKREEDIRDELGEQNANR